ncbi:Exonuclease [Frankliniella fusca]|uniref:Exonuclease n=1 Tax=Frankliniella fusca TaxID=407009 RepID=A0AAE1GVJ8_9NEOP|nr:Exonuclease [Frankliniella fusca]
MSQLSCYSSRGTLRLMDTKMSCTDRPCTWGQGSIVRDPGNVKDKDYGDETHKIRAYFDPRPTIFQDKTPKQLRELRHNFLKNVQRLYVTEPQPDDEEREYLFDLHLDYTYDPYEESKFTIKITIMLCKEFISNLRETKRCEPFQEEGTENQNQSKDWINKRSILFTASSAKRLCHLTAAGYKNFLRDNLWLLSEFQGSKATRYGQNKEKKARECYESEMKQSDPSVTVETSGLWRNPQFMEFGCSPDGIVSSKLGPKKLLEIKCPEMLKHGDPLNFEKYLNKSQQSRFCLHRSKNGELKLKKNHAYMYQIQMSMGILKLKECDFVVWSPKKIFIQTVQFNWKMWEEICSLLIPLHHRLLVPEYFLKRTPRQLEPCLLQYVV